MKIAKSAIITVIVLSLVLPQFFNVRASGLGTFYNLVGSQDGETFGWPTRFIGDVNNDGYEDFAVGALAFDTGGFTNVGRVAIYSGQTGAVIREHTRPFNEVVINAIINPDSAFFGSDVNGIGDANGDGFDDYVILDPRFSTGLWAPGSSSPNEFGRVIAFSGANGSALWTYVGVSPFQFYFGNSQTILTSDYNGDGRRDVAVGAPGMSVNARRAGAILILSAADGSVITQFNGVEEEFLWGAAFDTGFDVNNDAKGDFIIGEAWHSGVEFYEGRIRVANGNNFSTIYLIPAPVQSRFGFFGRSVAFVGDTSGDGRTDFAAGSREEVGGVQDVGAARVYSGTDGSLLREYFGSTAQELFGNTLAYLGDVNNNGLADLGSAAVLASTGAGRVDVFNSKTGTLWDRIPAGAAGEAVGSDIHGGRDINNDGLPDLILGSPGGKFGLTEPGRARVVLSDHTHISAGSNVEAFPVLGNRAFSITFASVSAKGNVVYAYRGRTSVNSNFRTRQGNKEEGWSITADASHSGTTQICLQYNSAVGYNEALMQIQHFEGGSWVNITATRDSVNKIICGGTGQLL